MKKSIAFLSVILLFTLSGCDSINNLFNVEVESDFQVNLTVDVTTPLKTGAFAFDESETFNPADEPELVDYINTIKEINVHTITAMIGALNRATFTLLNGTLTITDGTETVSYSYSDVTVTDGTELTITDTAGEFAKVSTMLTGLKDVTVRINGEVDASPTTFTVFTTLGSRVVAGI
jgi:hypothetical protein